MFAKRLLQIWAEPILRKIVFLMAIFIGAVGLLVGESTMGQVYSSRCKMHLETQHAKRSLGRIIRASLMRVESTCHQLAAEDDARNVRLLHEEILGRIESVERALTVLSNGGVYEYVIRTNFENADEFRETISYARPESERITGEAIELAPKLADLRDRVEELADTVRRRIAAEDDKSRPALADAVSANRMATKATLLQTGETANKILYDTSQQCLAIERENDRVTAQTRSVQYATAGVLILLCVVVAGVTLRQVVRILQERSGILSDSRSHHDHLDELVRERTAELARADEQLQSKIVEHKRAEEKLARAVSAEKTRALQQAVVARFGQIALSDVSLDELFDKAVALISQTLGTKYAKVLEHFPEQHVLFLRAGVGWEEGWVGHKSVPDGADSQGGYTLIQDKPVIAEDIHNETRFTPPALLTEHNVVGGMSVAIPGYDRPFGVLGVHTDRMQMFSEDDAYFLQAVANVLAGAIQHREGQDELQQRERFFAGTLNDMLTFVGVLEPNGKTVFVNNTPLRLAGIKLEDVKGRAFHDAHWWQYSEEARQTIQQDVVACASGKTLVREIEARMTDGLMWIEFSMHPIRDEEGEIECLVAEGRDIANRRQAEERLRESEERHRAITETAQDAVITADSEGNIRFWNKAAEKVFGFTAAEAVGRNMMGLIVPPQYREAKRKGLAEFAHTGGGGAVGKTLELTALRKDGTEFPIEISLSGYRKEDRFVAVAVVRDITERKQVEQKLRESEERFRQVAESSVEWIWEIDAEGRYTYCSSVVKDMLGYEPEELIGKPFWELGEPAIREELAARGRETMAKRQAFRRHLNTVVHKQGKVLNTETTGVPILDDAGNLRGYRGVDVDVTERKRAEEELRESNARMVEALERERRAAMELEAAMEQLEAAMEQLEAAMEEAEAATRSKSEFLANMSHEIRTPMTAILGFTEVLLEEGDLDNAPPERIEAARTIKRNGEYLLGIINDILDLSKIEAGRLRIERIACSPCRLIAEVASLVRVPADAKGLPFDIEYIGTIPETVQTDPTRLRQILINLIGNAIKFTETGRVRLVTRFAEDSTIRGFKGSSDSGGPPSAGLGSSAPRPPGPFLHFDVVDTGLGMTQEQVARLFQPFTQADTSTVRKYGGTGLGLTISRRFAGMLGGDIAVIDTKEGVGTRFRLTIATGPLKGVKMITDPMSATVVAPDNASGHTGSREPGTAPAEAGGSRTEARGSRATRLDCRILLVEDGPDNQRLIAHVLKRAGAEVTVTENGKLAVEMVLAARDEGNPFDVILMDMQMPVMDGYKATRLLRQEGYANPIIALTAHAMTGDREKCVQAGCDDYATKPIDRRKLIKAINAQLTGRDTSSEPQVSRAEVASAGP